jgi:DNA-directed RNA polymerase delta subunit
MQKDAMLTQLGYAPNDALMSQLERIENNTIGYEKIRKHIMDLHDTLKVDGSFVAMSNTNDYFKIKIEARSPALAQEAHEKIRHFSDKFKVKVDKLDNKETYYIVGFNK